MGVQGLWNLIEEAGTRVNVDSLNQKILAIDLSIWINQSIKGFRDKDGRAVDNAHLLGLFYRLCKLLFYQIKPIIVFDGDCPTLKLHTIQKRWEKKRQALQRSKNLSLNVLENYIQSQILPVNDERFSSRQLTALKSKVKFAQRTLASEIYLPPQNPKQVDVYKNFVELKNETKNDVSSSDEDEKNILQVESAGYHHEELQNINEVDINSEQFKSLPLITRYEILVEMRESYKQRKNTRTDLLPQESDQFSRFQMDKLLKKRNLQVEIENLIKELNGSMVEENLNLLKSSNKIVPYLTDGSPSKSTSELTTGTIASDERTRFILLKTLDQAIEEFNVSEDEEDIKPEIDVPTYDLPNALPGQSETEKTDVERIDYLSSQSSKFSFSSKQLSQNLDRNYKKYSDNKTESSALALSDDSSTDSEDFVEVPMDKDPEQDDVEVRSMNEVELFEPTELPYEINNNIKVPIEDNSTNSFSEDQKDQSTKEKKDSIRNIEVITIEQETQKETMEEEQQLEGNKDQNPEPEIIEQEIHNQIPSTSKLMNNDDNIISIDHKSVEKSKEESLKLSRQATSVNNQMISECQELLNLFGIPWIVAPAEAEAQCAMLEELGLCDGIITDDSDIFLFGGKNVYRNFFTNSKSIILYKQEDLKKYYGLDRLKFICVGMLCGTDYTAGIDGVGPVTAMEILNQFPGKGLEALENFAKWYRNKVFVSKDLRPENSVRAKFLRFSLPSTFPNRVIFDAYQNANVDPSTEPFSWSMPQLSELRQYTKDNFGWSEEKTDSFLLPVLKSLNSKQTQKRIDFYFAPTGGVGSRKSAISEKLKLKRSKRLNEAIKKSIKLSMAELNNNKNNINNIRKKRQRKQQKSAKTSKISKSTTTKAIDQTQVILSESSSSSDDE